MTAKPQGKICACMGKNLEKFIQPIILSILSHGAANGYQLIGRIGEYATFEDGPPDPTGVYRYLKIMEDRGLLERSSSGPKENLYVLTEEGRGCLENWKQTLSAYQRSLASLLKQL